ncbi:MAG: sigma-70 family RNA polymerase sigma factor [Myxococcales bacterium]|nr:sigma-70 family RNA polymerase sigma factor [Myxococcales bacterium]
MMNRALSDKLSLIAHAATSRDLRVIELLEKSGKQGAPTYLDDQELACYAAQSPVIQFVVDQSSNKTHRFSFGRKLSMDVLTPELIRAAVLDRDKKAQNSVIRHISEIVRFHVARNLSRYSRRCGRDPHIYLDDYFQITLLHLWDKNAYRLLAWDPNAGSARAYFGTITRHCVIEKLVSRNQSHQTEDATPSDEFEALINDADFQFTLELIEHKDLCEKLYDRLGEEGSEREVMLFDLLYRDGVDAAEAARALKLSIDAMHQAHCRLRKRLKQIAETMIT